MATYKKRGYKPKTKADRQAKIEEGSTTAEVFKSLDVGASKTEAWVEKNQKYILGFVGVIAVVVLGYLAYQQFIQGPKESESMNEMFQAQSYYEKALDAPVKDSLFNLALNGGEGKYGFLEIIENYGGTSAANVANYYAGMSYMQLGEYQNAIAYLDKFKGDDEMSGPIAKGAIGDAFAELGQNEDALKYYEDAASMKTNEVTTPRYLFKAGVAALSLGKNEIAYDHFTRINDDFPDSVEAQKAKIYASKAGAMK